MRILGRWLRLLVWAPVLAAQVPGLYIVELTGDPVAAAAISAPKDRRAAAAFDRRAAIRFEREQVRRAMTPLGVEVLEAVEYAGNALIVRAAVDAGEIEKLPGVRRVHPVYEIEPLLDRALPLLHVPEAWVRTGGEDRAGAGVKIAILDSGIDFAHPAFQDSSLPMPEGFPRASKDDDLAFTSSKVIVARSYAFLYGPTGDQTPRDRQGHGTAVAATAAGVIHRTPLGVLSGVAPKAWLGNYNLSNPGSSRSFRSDVVTKAFDDAVADGMNVINLSLGSAFSLRPQDDFFTDMVDRAMGLGILVVASAGNDGPEPHTVGSKAVAPGVIGVGASVSDRIFSGTARLGEKPYQALPGSGPNPLRPIAAPLADVQRLDENGLACGGLPAGSLTGSVAFILRGACTFEIKLQNAAAAGAVAALVYSHDQNPDAVTMSVGAARLPASMVSHTDGLEIRNQLLDVANPEVTLNFVREPFFVSPQRLAGFSSRGPNTDLAIKPDLIATGTSVYTAQPNGGYTTIQGTSFSSPLVAGAAAALMAARPSLTAAQYRSLLINSATPFVLDSGVQAGIQQAGSGLLNLEAAVGSTMAAFPASISFGAGGGTGGFTRNLTITNLAEQTDTVNIEALPFDGAPAPVVTPSTTDAEPGTPLRFTVRFIASDLEPGEYQGFLRIRGARDSSEIRVPYWYAVASDTPAFLKIVSSSEGGAPGGFLRGGVSVRITDRSGVPLPNVEPRVTVVSGEGQVTRVVRRDALYPGLFDIDVQLGTLPGPNVFRIEAGSLRQEVTIPGR